ncbi:MAG TPA: hypothetical protein VGM81_01610 [Burkholderiaceae bacterium]|jgi:deferrochelatase/peroxidase EfeB
MNSRVELDDIQGLLRYAYKHHEETAFLLLRVRDPAAARAWLLQAPVANALPRQPPPATVLQLGLSEPGMRALGLPPSLVDAFSAEFLGGLGQDASQARRLGDIQGNDPKLWSWGTGERVPHVLVMLYALPGRLADWQARIESECASGFELIERLGGSARVGREPFGFADGLSQPDLDWERRRQLTPGAQRADYDKLSCLGEFLLGYPNEYGGYTDRPLLAPDADARHLPRAEDAPEQADLGRNGSYLVIRQLEQDVAGFWGWIDEQVGGDPTRREALAAALVGRTLDGRPLAEARHGDPQDFDFDADPEGLRCPLGAHIRRSNPRSGDLPAGDNKGLSWLLRTLGLEAQALQRDQVASARFHRLLRRGRKYGSATTTDKVGLNFIALNASLSRQFEFVQGAWINSTRFNGLSAEADPLLGSREPDAAGRPTDGFSMPQAQGPCLRFAGLPQFITVRGGAYFFMPGIRALRYLAKAGEPHREDLP